MTMSNWTTRALRDMLALWGCGSTSYTFTEISAARAELALREKGNSSAMFRAADADKRGSEVWS